ncbi:MAG TPA: anti-virulence regulator CigR family protein [Magnetospirillum sp.]|nr:anti-virulence regulator CigR family protein [Magnetospirillum sp.]
MKELALVVLTAALAASPAFADPGGRHGGGHGAEREMRDDQRGQRDMGDVLVGAVITAAERALIGDYYRSHAVPVDSLPPGIRKKVARGKPLPPGIAKRFPDDLRATLPPRPGYDYRVVGADVLLVEIATGVIVDVVKDILR